jgi:hypothetical protein
MPLFALLLCLQTQDLADLVAQLGAVELEVRADAEARLNAADPARVQELRSFRAGCRDVEVRARLDGIVLHLLRRSSRRHYEEADLPAALRVLAEIERGEGQDPSATGHVEWAERRLKDLLRERSTEFGGDVLGPASWDLLAPQLEPQLPWVYPALIRGLAPGAPGGGNSFFILLKLGDRAVPALCWALRTSTPSIQARACVLLREIGTASPLVLGTLDGAARSPDAELRRQAGLTLGRLAGTR